jgi:hypothetical protein
MREVTLTPVDSTPDDVQYLEDRIYLLMRKRLAPI